MDNDISGLWDEVQFRQELHDRLFHGDIYNLTKPHRLTHLVLHHCKYTSKIYGLHNLYIRQEFYKSNRPLFEGDEDGKTIVQNLCVDGMIVGLSMLNVANKLYSGLKSHGEHWLFDCCVRLLVTSTGRLAKTIEDIDHMAQTNPIGEIVGVLQEMMRCYTDIFTYFGETERDLIEQIYDRLNFVEGKNIFSEQLQTQMLTIINHARDRNGLHPLTAVAARMGS